MTGCILLLFFLKFSFDKGCQSRKDRHKQQHTHCWSSTGSQSQTQHDWIFLCFFSCRGNIVSLREIKHSSGLLTVPPRHLLNLPFLPRRCVNWILCVYAHHFAGNWGSVGVRCRLSRTHVSRDEKSRVSRC